MLVLAIDSAMNGCSACVFDVDEGVLNAQHLDIVRGQAEHLMPLINDVMKKSDVNYSDLDMIAVTQGPGAFTGMRIGLSTAKSIGMVINKPVVGVSCFDAILESYFNDHRPMDTVPFYCVILETKRKDYYFKMFEGELSAGVHAAAMDADDIMSITHGKECLFVGDAVERYADEIGQDIKSVSINAPKADVIAKLAIDKYKNKDKNAINCAPVYLRLPEIGKPKNPPRVLK